MLNEQPEGLGSILDQMWPLRGLAFFKSAHHCSSSSVNETSSDHNQGTTPCASDCCL